MKSVDKWWTLKQEIQDKIAYNNGQIRHISNETNTLQMVLNTMDGHDGTTAIERQADIVSPQMADPGPCSTVAQATYDDLFILDSGAK